MPRSADYACFRKKPGSCGRNCAFHKSRAGAADDVWTWTAIDADTKLIPSWLVTSRDSVSAFEFCRDLASRMAHRVQVPTDGHIPYMSAIPRAFGDEIDYGVLVTVGARP